MWTHKDFILPCVLSCLILLSGCMEMSNPLDSALNGPKGQKTEQTVAKQFQEGPPEGPSAVESAIELSRKYAALSEDMTKLQMEKQNLAAENTRLNQQIAALETELKQAKKELSEANDLLIEMRIELNNWKTDVLGFRDEMRQADKVQLQTLVKILKVLGGDVSQDIAP